MSIHAYRHPRILRFELERKRSAGRRFVENRDKLKDGVNVVPEEIDCRVAEMKLASWGITIDALTPEQEKYINSWNV